MRVVEKSTWWGMEKNSRRRPLRRSSRRLKKKSLVQPIWPGNLTGLETKERSTMACRMTQVRRMISLGMVLPRGDTTQRLIHDTQQTGIDSETGHDHSERR
jgi:hypothetical protein